VLTEISTVTGANNLIVLGLRRWFGVVKCKIKPKRFDSFENANIVNNSDKNNSKALETTVTSICNTEQ
jgi:hypothetical protein